VGSIAAILVAVGAAIWAKRNWDIEVVYQLRHRPRLTMVGPHERARSREEAKARLGASDAENASGAA
ncbi:MAG TPA: hypothetical protein VK046_03150, partial [Actinomycetaceae bacterium]|nr:hypothetical protein [Actinomycetaceae bacterium]